MPPEPPILPAMLETLRAFIAVNLEIASVRRIVALQRSLRSSPEAPADRLVWVAPPNLHITLRSLGQIDRSLAPALADSLREVVQATAAMRVHLTGFEAFPSQSQARLLFVDVRETSGALEDLAQRIEQLAQSFGFEPDSKPFQPRIIFGRSREALEVTRWFASLGRSELSDGMMTECVLYAGQNELPDAEHPSLARIAFPTPARSLRPRATRNPSQRPRPRSRPPTATTSAAGTEAIPPPPRLPTLAPDSPEDAADQAVVNPTVGPTSPEES